MPLFQVQEAAEGVEDLSLGSSPSKQGGWTSKPSPTRAAGGNWGSSRGGRGASTARGAHRGGFTSPGARFNGAAAAAGAGAAGAAGTTGAGGAAAGGAAVQYVNDKPSFGLVPWTKIGGIWHCLLPSG
jgi:hypothetical protein